MKINKLTKKREFISLAFLIILFLVVGVINSSFLTKNTVNAIINSSVVYIIITLAMAFPIFIGEIDVSVGSTLGLTAAVVGSMLRNGQSWILSFFIALLIGTLVGLINGWGVTIMKIPSLIFTLGINGILRGILYIYTKGEWVENIPKSFKDFSSKTLVGGFSIYITITFLSIIILQYILTHTKKGNYFKAIGDNTQASYLVGIPVVKTKILAYILCGVLSSIAGIIFCSRIGFVTPTSGVGYEMRAVAGCVLGGVSLAGGVGSIVGSSIGAIIMSSISYILVFVGLSSNYDNAITGIILITIVVLDSYINRNKEIKTRKARLLARTSLDNEDLGVNNGK